MDSLSRAQLIDDWAESLAERHGGHVNYREKYIPRAIADIKALEEKGWEFSKHVDTQQRQA